jgi:hypothetical protein
MAIKSATIIHEIFLFSVFHMPALCHFKNCILLFPHLHLHSKEYTRGKLKEIIHARFEVFMAVEIQVKVFWVVMQCSDVAGYKCFRRTLHPEDRG